MAGREIIVCKVTGYISGAEHSFYFGTRGWTSKPSDTPADTHFAPLLTKAASMRRDCWDILTTSGRSRVGFGQATLRNVAPDRFAPGILDYLLEYAFDGRVFEQWWGTDDLAFPAGFTQVIEAKQQNLRLSRSQAVLSLRDRQVELDIHLQPNVYAGNNALPAGLEGGPELKDKPKPWCFGSVFNVPAVCVNTSKLIYQVHDGEISSITDVRDSGISLSQTPASILARTSGSTVRINAIASNGSGTMVQVGSGGVVRRSTDYGVTWAAAASSPLTGAADLYSVVWDPTIAKFVLGGDSAALWYSSDGNTWTQISGGSNPFGGGERIASLSSNGAGTILATGSAGTVATSTNGTSFTSRTTGFGATNVAASCWGRNEFVAVNTACRVERSADGITWTLKVVDLSGSTLTSVTGIAFGHDRYVVTIGAAGGNGFLFSSVDLVSWILRKGANAEAVPALKAVAYGGKFQLFIAAGGTGTLAVNAFYQSVDGENWWTVSTVYTGTAYLDPVRAICLTTTEATFCGADATVEGKVAQTDSVGTYSSQADLLDDTLAPKPGTYKVYAAGGYFRLGSPPAGQITVDLVQGANSAARTGGQFFAKLMQQASLGSAYSTSDVTTLDGKNSAVLGFWQGTEQVKINVVLDLIGDTLGTWWGQDRLGVFRIKRLEDPSSQSPAYTLYARDFVKALDTREANDANSGIPPFKTTLRYAKNYTVQASGLAGAVTAANQLLYGQEWQSTGDEDSSVSLVHPYSEERTFDTLFTVKSDADTEAARRQTLHGTKRLPLESALKMTATNLQIDLGDIVEIIHPRFGLSGGKNFSVMMQEPVHEPNRKYINIGVWG